MYSGRKVMFYMDTMGRVWKDPGGSLFYGKASFPQKCVFLVYAGHFFRELKVSDIAK